MMRFAKEVVSAWSLKLMLQGLARHMIGRKRWTAHEAVMEAMVIFRWVDKH